MSALTSSRPAVNELSFVTVRRGREVVVTAQLRNPESGPGFRAVDLMAPRPAGEDLFGPFRDAAAKMPEDTRMGLSGVVLDGLPGQDPITFTVSITLADTTESDMIGPEGAQVTSFALAGCSGQRLAQLTICPVTEAIAVPLLTVSYLAETGVGTLMLGFGTSHIDAAAIFSELFDAIARSVAIR